MEKFIGKKEGRFYIIALVIVALLCFGTIGYLIYDEFAKEDEVENNDNNQTNEQVKREEIDDKTLSSLNSIIENELYVLWNKENINEITNQERLQVALLKLADFLNAIHYSYLDTFTAVDLEEAFKQTSIGYLSLTHETIHPFIKLSVFNEDGFIYNEDEKIYTNAIFGSGSSVIQPYESLLKEAYYEDGLYYISYQYIWTITPDIGPAYYDLYYSYSDAYNHGNSYFSGDDTTGEIKEYINNNLDIIKENTDTYNYVFEKDNNNFVLIDFSKGE